MSFHVPEKFRVLNNPRLPSSFFDGNNGAFDFESPISGWRLAVIASDGMGWEHVSVHAYEDRRKPKLRTPTWSEMCFAKKLFWDDEDTVIQYHPKKSEYVNNHPNVLHLWRPENQEIPIPDSILVGIKEQIGK